MPFWSYHIQNNWFQSNALWSQVKAMVSKEDVLRVALSQPHTGVLRSSLGKHVTARVTVLPRQWTFHRRWSLVPIAPCSLLLGLLPQQNKPPETQKPTSSLLSTLQDLSFLGMGISSSRLNCHMQSCIIFWVTLLCFEASLGAEKFYDCGKTPASWINLAVDTSVVGTTSNTILLIAHTWVQLWFSRISEIRRCSCAGNLLYIPFPTFWGRGFSLPQISGQ